MKRYILSILFLATLAIGGTVEFESPVKHQTHRKEAVILYSTQGGSAVNGTYQYSGVQVYCSSSSTNAPVFPQGNVAGTIQLTETAEAMAQLLSEGYQIVKISDNGLMTVLEK